MQWARTSQIKAGEGCHSDQQIHFWLGEGPVIGRCGADCARLSACGYKPRLGSNNKDGVGCHVLDDLRFCATQFGCWKFVQDVLRFSLSTARREDLHGDHHCRDQICKCYADPHQSTGTLLILQRRQTEDASGRYITWVNNAAAKCEKRGKDVTGQRGEEEVHGHGPLRAFGVTRPSPNDRSPEQKARDEKGCVLHDVPSLRRQPQLEQSGNMPGDHCGRAREPAENRVTEKMSEQSWRPVAEK